MRVFGHTTAQKHLPTHATRLLSTAENCSGSKYLEWWWSATTQCAYGLIGVRAGHHTHWYMTVSDYDRIEAATNAFYFIDVFDFAASVDTIGYHIVTVT